MFKNERIRAQKRSSGLSIILHQFKSRSTWKEEYRSDVDNERFVLEFPIIFPLVLIAIIMGFMAITTLQLDTTSRIYEVATQSSTLLGYGMVVTFLVAIYPTKNGEFRFDAKFPERDTFAMNLFFVFITFGVARGVSGLSAATIGGIYNIPSQSTYTEMIAPVVFTAAAYEEILHSLGVTTGIYIIIYKLSDRVFGSEGIARYSAIISAPILDGAFFAVSHMGVYGTDPSLMAYLFSSRIVYGISYLYTRSAMVAFLPHVTHNLLMVWFGV